MMYSSQAREELNLTHFSYNEWPVGVAGTEEAGLVPGSRAAEACSLAAEARRLRSPAGCACAE